MDDVRKLLSEIVNKEVFKTTIDRIYTASAREIYGQKAINPERTQVVLQTKDGRIAKNLPAGLVIDRESKFHIKDRASVRRSLRNKNSWFRQYVEKYGKPPEVGETILAETNERGFVDLAFQEKTGRRKQNDSPS